MKLIKGKLSIRTRAAVTNHIDDKIVALVWDEVNTEVVLPLWELIFVQIKNRIKNGKR